MKLVQCTHHVPLADEPFDERYEGRDDGGVAHLLDDQHAQGRLVPRQPLRGRILDRPTKPRSTMIDALF